MKLYHLSQSDLTAKVLTPRIPDNKWTRNGHEENKTPRISFSTSIIGALMGITGDLTGKEFYVHEIDEDYSKPKIKQITNKEVPDQFITKEVWVLNDVKIKAIEKIKVTKSYEKIFKQGKGTMSNLTYDWKTISESAINGSASIKLKSIEKNDRIYNFDKWAIGDNNVIFVTGLSGSGKTTISLELERKYNAEIFSLDNFEHMATSNSRFVKRYMSRNPHLKIYIDSHWTNCDMDTVFYNEFQIFFKWLISEMSRENNKLFIVEGIQIYNMLEVKDFIGKPLIIKVADAKKADKRIEQRGGYTPTFGRHDLSKLERHSKVIEFWCDTLDSNTGGTDMQEKCIANLKLAIEKNDINTVLESYSSSIDKKLIAYTNKNVLPKYQKLDYSHGIAHIMAVVDKSIQLAELVKESVNINIVYAAAIYHDIGLVYGTRETHHLDSAKYVIKDSTNLKTFFSEEDIQLIAKACSEHRASANTMLDSIYSKILADADTICESYDIEKMIARAYHFSIAKNPEFTKAQYKDGIRNHLIDKYAKGGYATNFQLEETYTLIHKDLTKVDNILRDDSKFNIVYDRVIKSQDLIMSEISFVNEASNEKTFKCPYCIERHNKESLVHHIDEEHLEEIPEDHTSARVVFNLLNNKTKGKCTECGRETSWNEETWRYERFCNNPNCKKVYIEKFRSRMVNVHGTTTLLNDMEHQKKMLSNRKISGTYKFADGGSRTYTGSYEKNALEFMDTTLNIHSKDILTPGPIFEYTFEGKTLQFISDIYYIPYNLVMDIKDGGSNKNTHPGMEEYRAKQVAKEKAMQNSKTHNYIRLTDNRFDQLMNILAEIKLNMVDPVRENSAVIHINENHVKVMGSKKSESRYVILLSESGICYDKAIVSNSLVIKEDIRSKAYSIFETSLPASDILSMSPVVLAHNKNVRHIYSGVNLKDFDLEKIIDSMKLTIDSAKYDTTFRHESKMYPNVYVVESPDGTYLEYNDLRSNYLDDIQQVQDLHYRIITNTLRG